MSNFTSYALRFTQAASLSGEQRLLGWNVPESEIRFIPEHWRVYPEPPASLHYLLGVLYTFIYVAGLTGNGLVMWVFSTSKTLKTASNMFIVNLAFCDFIMMLKIPMFIYNSFMRGFATGQVGCQIFALIGSLSGIGAGMTNACIAYDRYATISNPLEGKLTHAKAFLLILLVWCYTLPWALLPMMEIWGKFVPEGYLTACTFDYMSDNFDTRMFTACIFVCSYAVPMSMIVYFYSQILLSVIAHEKALKAQAKKMNVESLRNNQDNKKQSAEIRIAKVAIVICFLFVAAWTPYAVMALIGAFGNKALLTPGVTMIPALACKSIACLDPWVYALSHPRYRQALQQKLPWLAINEPSDSDSKSIKTSSESTTEAAT